MKISLNRARAITEALEEFLKGEAAGLGVKGAYWLGRNRDKLKRIDSATQEAVRVAFNRYGEAIAIPANLLKQWAEKFNIDPAKVKPYESTGIPASAVKDLTDANQDGWYKDHPYNSEAKTFISQENIAEYNAELLKLSETEEDVDIHVISLAEINEDKASKDLMKLIMTVPELWAE